ncbi:MAG: aspartate--tRNA ligase [Candidatus Nanoarchaeia archaeon]|nr:aspartate--tRNA ligase [Candidatus Nanoarchaeia archaeon]
MLRTHTCGELTKKHSGKKVKLTGWVDSVRAHGKILFADLRDRYGKTQIVMMNNLPDIDKIKNESVILIEGEVKPRLKGKENKDLATGEIEVKADKIQILNNPPKLPFEINQGEVVNEDLKLQYRYLDLRQDNLQKNIILRHKITKSTMDYFDKQGFLYIETPCLIKTTPEGARDYVVPSRVNPGEFYALPQSPQLLKQSLMIAGFDKYFQIARCFRDEDLRKDRQPEFTQVDLEMSFVEEEDVYSVMEGYMKELFEGVLNLKLKIPFPRMTYDEAMKKYKSDKPDLRKDKNNPKEFAFCWVTDFPLFEYNAEEKQLSPAHHPFTMPQEEDIAMLDTHPEKVKAKCYDLVLNGIELGSGSIRISEPELQAKIFKIIKISDKKAKERFGFLLEALKFAPPHGGFAIGLDRISAIMSGTESIRDVIAFPKNKAAKDLMMGAPSSVDSKQLKELHIKIG